MDRGGSFAKSHGEDARKSRKKYKAFNDVSKYFSKKEWAKLGDSQKTICVYMKRNYDTMTLLGLRAPLPSFMRPKNQTRNAPESDSDEEQSPGNQDENPQAVSDVKWIEHEKELPMEPAREENDMRPPRVTPALEPAPKKLCAPGEVSVSGQETEKMSDVDNKTGHVEGLWTQDYRTHVIWLRERKNRVAYKEISDSEEHDSGSGCETSPSYEEEPGGLA